MGGRGLTPQASRAILQGMKEVKWSRSGKEIRLSTMATCAG